MDADADGEVDYTVFGHNGISAETVSMIWPDAPTFSGNSRV